jgi:hypothetical protein
LTASSNPQPSPQLQQFHANRNLLEPRPAEESRRDSRRSSAAKNCSDASGAWNWVTSGLKNLVLVTNAGGQKDRYTRYRFDGRSYRARDCFDVESLDSPTGEPKVTRAKCER